MRKLAQDCRKLIENYNEVHDTLAACGYGLHVAIELLLKDNARLRRKVRNLKRQLDVKWQVVKQELDSNSPTSLDSSQEHGE